MPLLQSKYKAPYFLRNSHLATVIPSGFRKIEGVDYTRERVVTYDNDFLDLDWLENNAKQLIVISHGLEGSANRPYVKGMAKYFSQNGWDVLAWNCRSCSGEMNNSPQFYHHGATEDIKQVIDHAIAKNNYKSVALVGFSMGGSMTLKYLGENGKRVPKEVIGGVAYSVPVNLKSSVDALSRWGNGFYRKRFLEKLEQKIIAKAKKYPDQIKIADFKSIKYFPDFDNLYTAPLYGFKDANDFYEKASAKNYMYDTDRPILLVNALNDPFLGDACYPIEQCENHELIYLETPKRGGHVGFSLKNSEFNFMEKRALEFLNPILN